MKLKDGKQLIIRKAKKTDARKIIEYLNEVGKESDNLTFGEEGLNLTIEQEEEIIKNISTSKNSVMLLGLINEKIASIGNISSSPRERIKHNGELGITVRKAFWNLGVGTIMMKKLIDFARNNGITEIVNLTVAAQNQQAIKLYKNMGFEQVGTYRRLFKIGNEYRDAIVMNLYL